MNHRLRRTLLPLLAAPALALVPLATADARLLPEPSAQIAAKTKKQRPISRAGWLRDVTITEYYPAPEAWFVGKRVAVPGLSTKHRIDWLYSAYGLSMEGDGIGLDGKRYHIAGLGKGGWVDERGRSVSAGARGWSASPYWRAGGYWRARGGWVTFPLESGGWSRGVGRRYVPLPGVSFAEGQSRPLRYYQSVAVDPSLIPLGSRIYIEAYRGTAGGGWFTAEDVGGAIIGRHIDVFRPPPPRAGMGGNYLDDQRIYVVPPGAKIGRDAPARKPAGPTPPADDGDGGASTGEDDAGGTSRSGGASAP